jgi:hypothetical protein
MTAHYFPEGDPRVPYPQIARTPDTVEAVRKARQQATTVTIAAAIVPTVLAMQGMASLAVDLLGFGLPTAIALAGFLELALVSFALLTRASALAGRPGGVDAIAVWVVSATSGLFSGAHELIGPAVGGARTWEVDPGSLLAAGVRLAAPLVAALLWERVLTAARREHEARTLVELRRDRRLIAVGVAALAVRQLEAEHHPGSRRHNARTGRARRRLQRAHVAALRMVGPGQDLRSVLAAVGAVDVLPAATIVQRLDAPPAVGQLTGPAVNPASRASHQEAAAEPRPGSLDQGGPAREPGDYQQWTTPDHVEHEGPAQGGPGWSTEPEAGQQLAQDAAHRAAESADEPRTGPVLGYLGPVRDQAGSLTDPLESRGPVVAAAEAAIRDASVLELVGRMSQRAIATRLGVARSTVARVVARHVASETSAVERESHLVDHSEPVADPVGHGADGPMGQWSAEEDPYLVG